MGPSDPGVLGLDERVEVSLDHLVVELDGVCVNFVVTRRDVLVLEPGLLAAGHNINENVISTDASDYICKLLHGIGTYVEADLWLQPLCSALGQKMSCLQ
jgi:hypothetical protein